MPVEARSIDKLRADAMDVNGLLSNYIAVHNALIKQSGIRGLFLPIDFDGLRSEAQQVLDGLKNKQSEIEALRSATKYSLVSLAERAALCG